MPIKIRCRCGQVLTVKDELAGKQAKCPKCQAALSLPPGKPPTDATGEKVQVACGCGQILTLPASAIGKRAKCPKCAQMVVVTTEAQAGLTNVRPVTESGGLADLLEEEGIVSQAHSEHGCPECGAEFLETAVICVNCGYSRLVGGKLKTSGLSKDEEKLHPTLRKAMNQVGHEKGEKVAEGGEGVTSWLVGLLLFGSALLVILTAIYSSRVSGVAKLAEARKQLKIKLGRDPDDKELAKELKMNPEQLKLLKAGNNVKGPSGITIAKGALLAITTSLVCVTWLWLLVIAFKEAVIHGVASLITGGLYQLYYVITRWEKCKPPFLIFVVCILLFLATMCI